MDLHDILLCKKANFKKVHYNSALLEKGMFVCAHREISGILITEVLTVACNCKNN